MFHEINLPRGNKNLNIVRERSFKFIAPPAWEARDGIAGSRPKTPSQSIVFLIANHYTLKE